MSGEHRCPKCASDQMMDGAHLAGAQGARVVVGVERHRERLTRSVSTALHASVCGSCGYVELYANEPADLYEAYKASLSKAPAAHPRT